MREVDVATSVDYVNLITMRGGGHVLAGTLVGRRGEPRIVMIDDHTVDVPPAATCSSSATTTGPGMIGSSARCSATPASTSPTWTSAAAAPGSALMVLATHRGRAGRPDRRAAAAAPGILSVHVLWAS